MERADTYFARLNEQRDELPVWFGEMYIETHRGTLTTEGKNKRANRMARRVAVSERKNLTPTPQDQS